MNHSLAHRLSEFGSCFDAAKPVWDRRHGLRIETMADYRQLVNRPLDALMLFTIAAHERPYASPRYPVAHRMAILKAIGTLDIDGPGVNEEFSGKLLSEKDFPERVWIQFEDLAEITRNKTANQQEKARKYTVGPVRHILERLREERNANLISHLMSLKLEEAHRFLKDKSKVGGIGHKIAAMFLRDIWDYVGGRQWPVSVGRDELHCIQPVDRWVKRWAEICWPPSEDWPASNDKCAMPIVNKCTEAHIDPVNFNKGAWFVGAHYQKLCSFFGVLLEDRLNYTSKIVESFDPNRVKNAIGTLASLESQCQIFSV